MEKWMFALLLAASPATLAQSAPLQAPPALQTEQQDARNPRQSVKLGAGELGTLGTPGAPGSARVAVLGVQDSRCPEDTMCIWAGEVQARVLLIEGGRWKVLQLRWRPGQLDAEEGQGQGTADRTAGVRLTAVSGYGENLRLTLSR
ncbi:hypothetical protein [Deinococcus proteolyticus]|nr:hypothetical protein [Deinococcus proteolyticus]